MPLDDEASKSRSGTKQQSKSKKISKREKSVASIPNHKHTDNKGQVQPESAETPNFPGSAFPPLERDPIATLFDKEPISPASRALRPLETMKRFWTIAGIAQRLNLPPALVCVFLIMLPVLIVAVGFLIITIF